MLTRIGVITERFANAATNSDRDTLASSNDVAADAATFWHLDVRFIKTRGKLSHEFDSKPPRCGR